MTWNEPCLRQLLLLSWLLYTKRHAKRSCSGSPPRLPLLASLLSPPALDGQLGLGTPLHRLRPDSWPAGAGTAGSAAGAGGVGAGDLLQNLPSGGWPADPADQRGEPVGRMGGGISSRCPAGCSAGRSGGRHSEGAGTASRTCRSTSGTSVASPVRFLLRCRRCPIRDPTTTSSYCCSYLSAGWRLRLRVSTRSVCGSA